MSDTPRTDEAMIPKNYGQHFDGSDGVTMHEAVIDQLSALSKELESQLAQMGESLRDEVTARLDAEGRAEKAERQLAEAEERNAALEEAHERIMQWCNAYPLDVFPEPDMEIARQGLEKVGVSLAAVSAKNMRHVLTGIKRIIDAATADHPRK